jgi:colicin import membrane protein
MSAELQQVTTAVVELDKVAAGLAGLKSLYCGIVYDVQTTKGMDDAKAARQSLRKPRYEIEAIRKSAKAPILALGKKLDSEAARITAEIMTIEGPIDTQIKNEETRKENERLAKIEAERVRVENLNARLDAIREMPIDATGGTAQRARDVLAIAEAMQIGDEYEDRKEEARAALYAAIVSIKGVVAEREKYEADQEQLRKDRAELEKLRADQAARLAEEQRQAKIESDAQAARIKQEQDAAAAELKRQRDEQAALAAAERKRIADEEAAAKVIRDAEAKKLAAERAEFERQQAEVRKAAEQAERIQREKARLASIQKPPAAELLGVLAAHYNVPTAKVIEWLLTVDLSQVEAA